MCHGCDPGQIHIYVDMYHVCLYICIDENKACATSSKKVETMSSMFMNPSLIYDLTIWQKP